MDQKDIQKTFSLAQDLHKKGYPIFVIVIIGIISLFGLNIDNLPDMFGSGAQGEFCEVTKIYDGDTMTLICPNQTEKVKVRLYCIDTPEMQQKPWGQDSRDHLRSIAGTQVKLVEIDKDRYGRIVGEVYTANNVNLNLEQVRAGKAAVYDAYCKKSEYKTVEQQAQSAKLGIWSESGLQQTPWDWRKQK